MQELLAAKRDLRLPQLLAKLDRFECVFLDDIGYVQHDRDEMEVLFTFLAERYERRSVAISILWNQKSRFSTGVFPHALWIRRRSSQWPLHG